MSAIDIRTMKHRAESILESDDKQFVSKAEKDKWNNCEGGSGNVDLSNYYTKGQVDTEIAKIKALMAGVKFSIAINEWTASSGKVKYTLQHDFDLPIESTSITLFNSIDENIYLDWKYVNSNTIEVYSDVAIVATLVIKHIVEAQTRAVDLSNYYTKPETDSKIEEGLDKLVGAAPEALDTLKELGDALGNDANFSTTITNLIAEKAPKVHKHDEYLTSVDIVRTFVPYNNDVPIMTTSRSDIYQYSIKGKSILTNGTVASVGESESNKILIESKNVSSLNSLNQAEIKKYMLDNGTASDYSDSYGADGIGLGNTSFICSPSFFKTATQYLFKVMASSSAQKVYVEVKYADSVTKVKTTYNCGWPSPYVNISLLTDANRTVESITFGYGHCYLWDNSLALSEYSGGNITSIQLDAPLRSLIDGTVYDEIKGNVLIRRVSQQGNTITKLENEVISNLPPIPISVYEGRTEVIKGNTIKPTIEFNYPEGKLGVLDKLEEDIFDVKSEQYELFQSVSSGKNSLETVITDKGGVVSKVGEVATFDELKLGINSIPTGDPNFIRVIRSLNNKFDLNIDSNATCIEVSNIIDGITLDSFKKTFKIKSKIDFAGFNMNTRINLSKNDKQNNKNFLVKSKIDFTGFNMEVK